MDEVSGDQLLIGVGEDALHVRIGGLRRWTLSMPAVGAPALIGKSMGFGRFWGYVLGIWLDDDGLGRT